MDTAFELLELAGLSGKHESVQADQFMHRLELIKFFNIKPGDKVLEIGCGQGDMTAALAYSVGKFGYVHAVDNASSDYGMPETLGQARDRLAASRLGGNIHMQLSTNAAHQEFEPMLDKYDCVVLSHCSWYFNEKSELLALLGRLKRYTNKLCFAEWDLRAQDISQMVHLMAVNIQAQYSCQIADQELNIRTLFSIFDIMSMLQASGWEVENEDTIDSSYLQDGLWEACNALQACQDKLTQLKNVKLTNYLLSQLELLKHMQMYHDIKSLPTFVLTAKT